MGICLEQQFGQDFVDAVLAKRGDGSDKQMLRTANDPGRPTVVVLKPTAP